MSIQDDIYEWEREAKLKRPVLPKLPSDQEMLRRVSFIGEELVELMEAFRNDDLTGAADALGDILWVTYGTAHSCGIDLDAVVREISRSNWSKFTDGVNINPGGKIIKGPAYSPPDIDQVLMDQEPLV